MKSSEFKFIKNQEDINKVNNKLLERLVKISAGQMTVHKSDFHWQNKIKKAVKDGEIITIYPGENVVKNLEKEMKMKEKRAAILKEIQ